MVNYATTLASIILNMVSCPFIILLNVLVIVAVKTRPRLQLMSNILLACLAGTDLLVGAVAQPALITAEIFAIAGSVNTYCKLHKVVLSFRFLAILTSLFHLVLLSVERYIALKYALRYEVIVTKLRLKLAVSLCWFIAVVYTLFRNLEPALIETWLTRFVLSGLLILSMSIIAYSHFIVYLITRRHERQIRTEQISGEDAVKYLEEKKAWKTTIIIIGFIFLSFLPGLLLNLLAVTGLYIQSYYIVSILRPFSSLFLMLNSLCNPIIYCLRNRRLRQAMIALLTSQNAN